MGIQKVIDVKVNSEQAKKEFDKLSESIQLQEQYVADLRLKIAQYEKSLLDLGGTQKIIREGEIKKLNAELKEEAAALKTLKVEAQGVNKVLRSQTKTRKAGTVKALEFNETLLKNRDISSGLSKITGGLSYQIQSLGKLFVSVGKGIKASTLALSGFQKVLLATGIGLLVVAVGTLAANWDKVKVALGAVSKEQEKQLTDAKELVTAQEEQYKNTTGTEESLKRQGKTEREITNLKIKQTNETINALEAQLETQKTVKDEQVKIANRNKTILKGILEFVSAPLMLVLKGIDKAVGFFGKESNLAGGFSEAVSKLIFNPEKISEEADKAISETEKKLQELKNRRDGFLNKIKSEDDAEAEKEKKKKEKEDQEAVDKEEQRLQKIKNLREKYKQAEEDRTDLTETQKAERQKERALAELNELKATEDQKAEAILFYDNLIKEAKIQDELTLAEQLEEIEEKKRDIRNRAFNDAAKLAGEESRLGKAILVAKTILAAKENILETKKTLLKAQGAVSDASIDAAKSGTAIAQGTAETAKIGFPQNIPMLIAYAAQAVGVVAAIKSAVSKTKAVASGVGAGGGVGVDVRTPDIPAQAPAFNIVGASGTNQLATAIGQQQQQPIKAFVVSDDVSTAQELDRNIVTGATI
jgi:hypothetical protein